MQQKPVANLQKRRKRTVNQLTEQAVVKLGNLHREGTSCLTHVTRGIKTETKDMFVMHLAYYAENVGLLKTHHPFNVRLVP